MTLTPNTGSGPVRIVLDAAGNYVLSQPNAEPENGTYIYAPSGNMATLVLTPNTEGIARNVNLVLSTSTQGTYTSDSLGQGTFTLDSPLANGCGPY